MELAELLESEGLDPEELMPWAAQRADALVAGLAQDQDAAPLRALLEAGASVEQGAAELTPSAPAGPDESNARGEAPPLSVDELPPPPEQPVFVDGEPEPLLAFDTGPIDLDTPEAEALLAATSGGDGEGGHHEPEAVAEVRATEGAGTQEARSEEPPGGGAVAEEAASEGPRTDEELEEIELDELVEIDDDELEVLEEVDEPEAAAPPPPPPPPSYGASQGPDGAPEVTDLASLQSGDVATELPAPVTGAGHHDDAPMRRADTAAHSPLDGDAEVPVRTGDTAALPIVEEPSEDFDLDFDDDD